MPDNERLSVATHFGRQVRKARLARGWTLRELSRQSDIDAGNLSRIENGHRAPTAAIAMALDAVFPERDGWFSDWHRESLSWSEVPAGFRSWTDFEDSARTLFIWSPSIIDGLLQTASYARALVLTSPGITDEQVSQRVAGRMERQRRVLFRGDPPAARFLVDELSLHRVVGSREIMAGQLRHLLDVAAMATVTVQVMPAIAHSVNAGELIIADSTTAAYCEHAAAGYVYTDGVVVSSLAARFDALRAECHRASQSQAIIERMCESYEQPMA
jgi:transcriptional regulator with XRE-family HTH domain